MPAEQVNITLGTAGHIDHGKTVLIKCLTGCETDRLKEEKQRGMSIDLGFAPCTIGDSEVGIVDVPGHENFIKTMVAGAAGMDGVILVVAADDGVMPQTREHLDILTLLGVRHGLVALTKIDRVESDMVDLVTDELTDFLRGTFLEGAPIMPLSGITGEGAPEFAGALRDVVAGIEPKRSDGLFRVPVDRGFQVKGYGTVVSGIPVAGSATLGDELDLLPDGVRGRLRAAQVYGRDADIVRAGQCAALNVREWDARQVRRGQVVTVPGYFEPAEWIVGRLRLLPHEHVTLRNGSDVRLHTGTSDVPARVYLMRGDRMGPGETGLAQFHAEDALVVAPGDPFIVRLPSPARTIGGGTIVEAVPRRLKRTRPEVLADLDERAEAVADERSFLAYGVRRSPDVVATPAELSARAKIAPERVRSMLAELIEAGDVLAIDDGRYLHARTLHDLGRQLRDVLADYHRASPETPGTTRDELRDATGMPADALDVVLDLLIDRGDLAEQHRRIALPEHQSAMTTEDRDLIDRVEGHYRRAAFKPPAQADVARAADEPESRVAEAVRVLLAHETLVEVAPGMHFHAQAVELARRKLTEHIQAEGRLESVDFKYLLDTTRKFALPLLDYFDKINVTRRVGHTRYLR